MKAPSLAQAVKSFERAAKTSDNAWAAYRKTRERHARKRGQFAAEQAVIDAGLAVHRAQERLELKRNELHSAVYEHARSELIRERAAALLPRPTREDISDLRDRLLAALMC